MTAQTKLKSNYACKDQHIDHDSNLLSRQIELFSIAIKMKKSGLSDSFIVNSVRCAFELEGISDLMYLWAREKNSKERDAIIADIQDLLDANETNKTSEEIYIKFNDLEKIAKNIREFKDALYQEVMSRGGISKLSELTGIPQPSLSRFFNSRSMPRRSTVLSIAKALDLNEIAIDLKWCK